MKTNSFFVFFVFLVIIFSSIFSCSSSNELTREKAATLVSDFYSYPNIEFAYISTLSKYEPLIKQGLLKKPNWKSGFGPPVTSKGLKYSLDYAKDRNITLQKMNYYVPEQRAYMTNIQEFNEITGIVFLDEEKTKAQIEFSTIRKKITPFGEVVGYKEGDIVNFGAAAALYDDGWRIITQVNLEIFKAEDFKEIFPSN